VTVADDAWGLVTGQSAVPCQVGYDDDDLAGLSYTWRPRGDVACDTAIMYTVSRKTMHVNVKLNSRLHQCSRIHILRFFQISKNMTFYVFLK